MLRLQTVFHMIGQAVLHRALIKPSATGRMLLSALTPYMCTCQCVAISECSLLPAPLQLRPGPEVIILADCPPIVTGHCMCPKLTFQSSCAALIDVDCTTGALSCNPTLFLEGILVLCVDYGGAICRSYLLL